MTAGDSSVVSTADVNGTDVYGADGTRVGHIDHLMIDKVSGKIAYAVMGFGGFLGVGEEHYTVPWGSLSYDTPKGGFTTNITQEQLSAAPPAQRRLAPRPRLGRAYVPALRRGAILDLGVPEAPSDCRSVPRVVFGRDVRDAPRPDAVQL